MGKVRRDFTREFKIEAVRLSHHTDKTLDEFAEDMGISPDDYEGPSQVHQYLHHNQGIVAVICLAFRLLLDTCPFWLGHQCFSGPHRIHGCRRSQRDREISVLFKF